MKKPETVRQAEEFGRVRLSRTFFMRDFLYSEISAIHGIPNFPDDPDAAIASGRELCEGLLEPLQATFGRLAIRSAYRSPAVNAFGCANRLSCASNAKNVLSEYPDFPTLVTTTRLTPATAPVQPRIPGLE